MAQRPAATREAARLLNVGATLEDGTIRDLPGLLRAGDLLVLNDTRVLPTRFWGRRDAVPVEVTLVEPIDTDGWWALARPGRRLRAGDSVALGSSLVAKVLGKDADGRVALRFDREGEALLDAIRREGAMPLPPYIRRSMGGDPADLVRYQTVFGHREGSVAAPTASLHLTHELLEEIAARGVGLAWVTLHVGMGTFAPIKVDDPRRHPMHTERYAVPPATAAAIARCRGHGGRVVAVGTTVLRAMESAADEKGRVQPCHGSTAILIAPGWRFASADLLLTNFHLPRSTLFMLACAFTGTARLRAAYAHAIAERYRFFSYGDACLLERSAP